MCYNGTSSRFNDMITRFGCTVQEFCVVSNWVLKYIFDHHNWKLTTLNQPWLSSNFLELWCQTIHKSGVPLQNCWGFVDGIW